MKPDGTYYTHDEMRKMVADHKSAMSTTPRTDAAAFSVPDPAQFHPDEPIEVTHAFFTRELERENARLRDALGTLRTSPSICSYMSGYRFSDSTEIMCFIDAALAQPLKSTP
jgi:hypothetical protein